MVGIEPNRDPSNPSMPKPMNPWWQNPTPMTPFMPTPMNPVYPFHSRRFRIGSKCLQFISYSGHC